MAINIDFSKMYEMLLMIKSELEELSEHFLKDVSEEERQAFYSRVDKRYYDYALKLNNELHIEEDKEG